MSGGGALLFSFPRLPSWGKHFHEPGGIHLILPSSFTIIISKLDTNVKFFSTFFAKTMSSSHRNPLSPFFQFIFANFSILSHNHFSSYTYSVSQVRGQCQVFFQVFCILIKVKTPLPASIAVSTTQSRFSSS